MITKKDYSYVVVPIITVWVATEKGVSKSANQISVKMIPLDAATGEKVSSTFLDAKTRDGSSLHSMFYTDSAGPDQLLSTLANDYADYLNGKWWSL